MIRKFRSARVNLNRSARVNVKLFVILGLVVGLLVASAFIARSVRRGILAGRDLAQGLEAYRRGDWATARRCLADYLERKPEDMDALGKYAESLLRQQPLEAVHLMRAAAAYRQVLGKVPDDSAAYRRLASLYTRMHNFSELAYVANRRLQGRAGDAEAQRWLAEALMGQGKRDDAKKALTALIDQLTRQEAKDPQYVRVCVLLAVLASAGKSPDAAETLSWLDKAVKYDPQSADAVLQRARFYRMTEPPAGKTRQAMLDLARKDLEQAEKLPIDDPHNLLVLAEEWMMHRDLDRSAKWLQAARQADGEKVREHFVDRDDWLIGRCMLEAELSIRRQRPQEGVAAVDALLAGMKDRGKRLSVLAEASRVCLAAGQVEKARTYLDEHLALLKVLQAAGAVSADLAMLQARVAMTENRPDEVIRVLEPLARGEANVGIWKMLGQAYSMSGQELRATQALTESLKQQPKDSPTWMLLARQYVARQDWPKALEAAGQAETFAPDDPTAKMFRIEMVIHVAEDKVGPADPAALAPLEAELAGIQKAHPDLVAARLLQVRLAEVQGKGDPAEKACQQAIADFPKSAEPRLLLADLYERRGQKDQALAACLEACKLFPDRIDPWRKAARMQQARGQNAEAAASLTSGMQAVTDPAGKRTLGRSLAMLELLGADRKAGVARLTALAEQDPRDVQTRSLLLSLPEVIRDAPRAQGLLDEIRTLQGDRSLLWRWHQARLWLADDQWRGRFQEIEKTLLQWMTEEHQWSYPAVVLARMYLAMGQTAQAEALCRRAMSLNAQSHEVAEMLVGILERQNRHDEAKRVLAGLENSTREVSDLRVRTALAGGDMDDAIQELKLRVSDNARDVTSYIVLAQLIYRKTKDLPQALAYLDKAETAGGQPLLVQAARVAILKAEGKQEQARKILDDQVARSGSFDAYLLRARYLISAGQYDQAEKDLQHLTELDKTGRGVEYLAAFYLDRGRAGDAVAALDKGLKEASRPVPLQRLLVDALLRRKEPPDTARAEKILDDLERQLGPQTDLTWTRAGLLLGQGDPQAAAKAWTMLNDLVERDPSAVNAYLLLINRLVGQRQFTRAREMVKRALNASPENLGLVLAKARLELAADNPSEAAAAIRPLLLRGDEGVEIRRMLAAIAAAGRDALVIKEAQAALSRALRKNPGGTEEAGSYTNFICRVGRVGDALDDLESCAKTPEGAKNLALLVGLAEIYRLAADSVAGAIWLDRATGVAPDDPTVLKERLALLSLAKQFEKVLPLATQYAAKPNADLTVLMTAANVLASSDLPTWRAQAKELGEKILTDHPDAKGIRSWLGDLQVQIGNPDRAEELYRQALEKEPKNVQALNGLAWVLGVVRGKVAEALPLASRAVEAAPYDYHYHDTLGVILSNLPSHTADARVEFEKCVELTSADSPARAKAEFQLGRISVKLAQPDQARKHLQEALRINGQRTVLTPEEKKELDGLLAGLPRKIE